MTGNLLLKKRLSVKMFQVKFHEGALDWAKPPSLLPGGTHTFPPCLPPAVCSCHLTCDGLVRHLSDPTQLPAIAERKAAGLVTWISKQKKQWIKERAHNREAQSRRGERSRSFLPFQHLWALNILRNKLSKSQKHNVSAFILGEILGLLVNLLLIRPGFRSRFYLWFMWIDIGEQTCEI